MSAQHTPGPVAERVERAQKTIDTLVKCLVVLPQALAFTYTVERFMCAGNGIDPRVPPTESEVSEAMRALRATIARVTGDAK